MSSKAAPEALQTTASVTANRNTKEVLENITKDKEANINSAAFAADEENPENATTSELANNVETPEGTTRTPHSLVTDPHVLKALENDKGPEAKLLSWEVQDFTSRGDNYACVVSSVLVDYELQGKEQHVSYVVKLNPLRPMLSVEEVTETVFEKEGGFYTILAPLLNAELEAAGQPNLQIPRCIHTHLQEFNQIIFLEDLRERNFKMYERRKGLDQQHATMVLKELGRLHGAGFLLLHKTVKEELLVKFPFLKEGFVNEMEETTDNFKKLFVGVIESSAEMAENFKGYAHISKWLRNLKEEAYDIVLDQVTDVKDQFRTVCHGDCWNNNILFRYDNAGVPQETMLLDVQMCRVSSPATDLNYFMYSSFNGNERKPNIGFYLTTYYESLTATMEAGGMKVPFTLQELEEEYHSKHMFGLLISLLLIPLVLASAEEVPDFSDVKDDMVDEFIEDHKNNVKRMAETNPLIRPRLLDMLDEMIEYDVINFKIK